MPENWSVSIVYSSSYWHLVGVNSHCVIIIHWPGEVHNCYFKLTLMWVHFVITVRLLYLLYYGELTLCGDWLSDVHLPNGYNYCIKIITGFFMFVWSYTSYECVTRGVCWISVSNWCCIIMWIIILYCYRPLRSSTYKNIHGSVAHARGLTWFRITLMVLGIKRNH